MGSVNFLHVKRKANAVSDYLANELVHRHSKLHECDLDSISNTRLRSNCLNLAKFDIKNPDVGVNRG